MLFEMIFWLDYYSRRSLKPFGWYGLSDTFTKTWSGGPSCVFVFSSLPAIVVDGSKSFSFQGCSLIRILSSNTPGSVSLVLGFAQDKVFPNCSPIHSSNRPCLAILDSLLKLSPFRDYYVFKPFLHGTIWNGFGVYKYYFVHLWIDWY